MFKIIGVVVTYNCAENFKENLASYLMQLDYLMIVDNSTDIASQNFIKDLANTAPDRISLVRNGKNIGLAGAQNIGINYALANNYDFILFLDDDSKAGADMVAKLVQAYENLSKTAKNIALLGANIHFKEKPDKKNYYLTSKDDLFFSRKTFTTELYLDVISNISSGSMVKCEVIAKLGAMHEDFFIDYCDFEYCLRLISCGYRIFIVKDAILEHNLGKMIDSNIFKCKVLSHSPSRRFYVFRNRIWVWKLYWFKVPAFVIYDFLLFFYHIAKIILLEPNKMANLANIIKGIGAGLWLDVPATKN